MGWGGGFLDWVSKGWTGGLILYRRGFVYWFRCILSSAYVALSVCYSIPYTIVSYFAFCVTHLFLVRYIRLFSVSVDALLFTY